METYRSVLDIIKQILNIIPENEIQLINELNKYVKTLYNKAPELLKSADCWMPLIHILNYYIPDIIEEWHIKIDNLLKNN